MGNQDFSKYKGLFIVLAVIIVLWAILGMFDLKNVPYSGYYTDGDNTVIRIYPDGPAEHAGFMKGDRMISNGGIDVKDTRALTRRPRAEIGEIRTYVFERNGETVSIDLTFTGMPAKQVGIRLAVAVIGFCFLLFGLLAYFRVKNKSTTLFALVGLCFGFTFITSPYISSYMLRMILQSIGTTAVILGLAFLLHFMMTFPKDKAMLKKKNVTIVLYGPAVLMILYALLLVIFQPEATSALNTISRILFNVLVAGYFLLAAVAMVHSFVKATPKERTAHGLKFMLFGTIIGLAPLVITLVIYIFLPQIVLPGEDYYLLTFVLIPISFALACIKSGAAPAATKK